MAETKKRTAEMAELDVNNTGELPDDLDEEQIQRMLAEADQVHIEQLTASNIKRLVNQLERKIKKNQEMRIKFPDEPEKFLKSEVDLDEELKRWSQLAASPELYGEFVECGGVQLLVNVLTHANTDIAVDVLDVLNELTDAEAVGETENPQAFVDALLASNLPELSVDTLLRINEEASEEDAKAVSNALSVVENLTDLSPDVVCLRYAKVSKFLPWLLKRIRQGNTVDYNKLYAAEILGILCQNSNECKELIGKADGIDRLLRAIAVYRKKDPDSLDEEEFLQNLFDCLCSLMMIPAHQITFGKAQGLELMIRMLRERKFSARGALKLSNYALANCAANCEIYVDKLGLKPIFSMFMQKGVKVKRGSSQETEDEEHVVAIIQSLCKNCTGTATARVLNKFTENQSEKLERLLELHEKYTQRVREAEERAAERMDDEDLEELKVDKDEQKYLDRCEGGLFTLQQVGLIIVRLANMGNTQVSMRLLELLDIKGVGVEDVAASVEEYCERLDEKAQTEREEVRKFARYLVEQKTQLL
eukprot:GDKI01035335.1.p1 GENE.GDKI01035335.1~~GDKI01035335.1.p1  ORF type:complete len:534 (-),score=175.30 GDKI01035335.1:23-1624(-)